MPTQAERRKSYDNYDGDFVYRCVGKYDLFVAEGKEKVILVNRFQPIASDGFVLTYTNLAEEQAQLDFVFEDNFGQRVEYTVTFAGKRADDKEE